MLLEVERLTKSFGGLMALNFVSFSIEEGEVIGLIGPNGLGKSPSFNVITGTLPASSGQVIFGGLLEFIERVIRLGNPMPAPAFSTDVAAELKGEGEMT